MKPLLMLAALAALPASSRADGPDRESLMDEIERRVRLPIDARPLSEYGRYYFLEAKGRVTGIYLHAFDPRNNDHGLPGPDCAQGVTRGGKPAVQAVPCPRDPAARRSLRAGRRQWVAGRSAVPAIFDGGCHTVHVTFDIKARKVEYVGCNGLA